MTRGFGLAAVLCGVAIFPATLSAQNDPAINSEARAIFQQLIEINTTDSTGSVTKASEAMAKRLLAGGFAEKDVIVAGPNERKKNLIVRYHGSGRNATTGRARREGQQPHLGGRVESESEQDPQGVHLGAAAYE